MNKQELQKKYTNKDFISKFIKIYSFKQILSDCIIKEDYDFYRLDLKGIKLSESGSKLLGSLKQIPKYNKIDERLLKIAIFLEFYNNDLFIDIVESDTDEIEKIISNEIIDKNILFPWIYGRALYDKYYEEFDEQNSIIRNNNVIKLLDNTPYGVFQLANLTIGPFGIQYSQVKRNLPPTRKLGLWHCKDPSCPALHKVNLDTATTIINKILYDIDQILDRSKVSEWPLYFFDKSKGSDFYDDKQIDKIPLTLAYSFGNIELKDILRILIDEVKDARKLLPINSKLKGSSQIIVDSLSKDECFQLILLFDSKDILIKTEKLISLGIIKIPSTEKRISKITINKGFLNIYHECNQLGFRSVSSDSNLSFIHLKQLILHIYQDKTLQEQLEWLLKNYDYETINDKLDYYLKEKDPSSIIKELVLNGHKQLTQTFDYLNGYFTIPKTQSEETDIINKILWKLGFDINIYPKFQKNFDERIDKFRETISNNLTFNSSQKDNIRSSAVNLFVSLEELLKHSLAFTTWLLLSDHYSNTHFKYNYSEATKFMTKKLDNFKLGDETILKFDSTGKNTLFPLVEGFTALFSICDDLIENLDPNNIRKDYELPSFVNKTNLVDFQLFHKIFVLDIKRSSYDMIKEISIKLVKEFNKFKVLNIRNSLEHDRLDFPTRDELISGYECIYRNITNFIECGIFPNVYLFDNLSKDKYNRSMVSFVDYNYRKITFQKRPTYKGYNTPSIYDPNIILPNFYLKNSTEPIRIKYEEDSEYISFWKNYPRKKVKKE